MTKLIIFLSVIVSSILALSASEENKTQPIFSEEMSSVTLSCDISFDSNISVNNLSWYKTNYKNNVSIDESVASLKDSSRFLEVVDNNSLIISSPKREDAGLYTAVFEFQDQTSYHCHVEFQAGPWVRALDIATKNLFDGNEMKLQCVVNGYPYPVVTWYKNGQLLNGSSVGVTLEVESFSGYESVSLIIPSAKFADDGDYTCEAYSALLNETDRKTIKVQVKAAILKIEPEKPELLLKVGANTILNCTLSTADENADLKWTFPIVDGKEHRELAPESSIKRSAVDNVVIQKTLQINYFDSPLAGEFKCSVIVNNMPVDEKVIRLTAVKESKTQPIFSEEMTSATLSCDISFESTNNVSELTWEKTNYKNNISLDESVASLKDSRFLEVADNKSLIISSPKLEDAGVYTAVFKLLDQTTYKCQVEFQAGPLVKDFEKSKNLIEGDKMVLQCVVKGYPYPVVTWYKNGQFLNGSAVGVQLESFSGHKIISLIIPSVEFADEGDYTCEAYSALFNETDRKTIKVQVKDKLAALWPFLGIVCEVVVLCTIIFIYEKRRNKQVQLDEKAAEEVDGSTTDKKEGLRHRTTNNATA